MALKFSFLKKTFHFAFDARTSRGAMRDKVSWFVRVRGKDLRRYGVGECSPLPGLSIDAVSEYETILDTQLEKLESLNQSPGEILSALDQYISLDYPSILFGVETALRDLINGGDRVIYHNSFIEGVPIPINGLIWMGDESFMLKQVDEKIAQGFSCLKLKIGGLDFDHECRILEVIRGKYGDRLTLRLDANGSFRAGDARMRLERLSKFGIHSIEQPLMPGDAGMKALCENTPIPIALDEELIGVKRPEEKVRLLDTLNPQYIILKPTLHGGLKGCEEWIRIAGQLGIGWWITSALESNVGLNAICQFTANYPIVIPQGLGTGGIYTNNEPSLLKVAGGMIGLVSEK